MLIAMRNLTCDGLVLDNISDLFDYEREKLLRTGKVRVLDTETGIIMYMDIASAEEVTPNFSYRYNASRVYYCTIRSFMCKPFELAYSMECDMLYWRGYIYLFNHLPLYGFDTVNDTLYVYLNGHVCCLNNGECSRVCVAKGSAFFRYKGSIRNDFNGYVRGLAMGV